MKAKTSAIFSRDPALPGIDFCRVTKSRHHFPDHFHDDIYIVSLILSGHCYCLGQKRQDTASGPGSVTLLNPGQIHSGRPADDRLLDYALCHINIRAMRQMARELELYPVQSPEFSKTLIDNPMLSALLNNLFTTLFTSRDSLEKEALLVSACHFIFSRYGSGSKPDSSIDLRHPPVNRAREILSNELDQKITLAEVAGQVGLSRYHFMRTFKRETGISPHMYRTLKRIEAAKSLLKQKTAPAQVAMETGFTDQSHFSNTFRRYVGATPGQYFSEL